MLTEEEREGHLKDYKGFDGAGGDTGDTNPERPWVSLSAFAGNVPLVPEIERMCVMGWKYCPGFKS